VLIRDLHPHLYADDTQIYGFCSPDRALALQERVTECINDVATCMRLNRLQLNAAKTEVLWCASGCHQGQFPDVSFTVGCDTVKPVRCVRDLGIYLDSDVSLRTHVSKMVAICYAALRQITRTFSEQTSAAVTSYITDTVKTGLWHCCTSGCPRIPARLTTVSTTCCSTSGERLEQVRPCYFIAPGPSLVAGP